VLFLCPHGAAKSVLASAYFQRLAKERGLNVRVESAGTEPEPAVSAGVATHLKQNGYVVPIGKPRAVTPHELATADVVISIGCDLSGLPAPRGALKKWDEVPPLSEDFAKADAAIRARVLALVEELVRAKRWKRSDLPEYALYVFVNVLAQPLTSSWSVPPELRLLRLSTLSSAVNACSSCCVPATREQCNAFAGVSVEPNADNQLTVMTNAEVVCVDGVDGVEAVVIRDRRTARLSAVTASAFLSAVRR
jgi:arsenate reductase (thioredoxin)